MTTILAQIKERLDSIDGLAQTYRDGWVPENAAFPYASILDPISAAPALSGDARTLKRRRLAQVDLWQDEAAEDLALLDVIVAALDGWRIEAGRIKVIDVRRIPEPDDENIVHDALTLSIPTS